MKTKWTINKLLKKWYIKYVIRTCKYLCIGCPYKYDCYYEIFSDPFPTWKQLREYKKGNKNIWN